MGVSSFVSQYSTPHCCDGSTRPGRDRRIKARRCTAVPCTFGWECCCCLALGREVGGGGGEVGVESPGGFLSKFNAAGQ